MDSGKNVNSKTAILYSMRPIVNRDRDVLTNIAKDKKYLDGLSFDYLLES